MIAPLTVIRSQRGLTLLELVIALTILSVLASAILPVAETSVKRSKELELRRALRTIRTAIDEYKADYEEAVRQKKINKSIGETGYPEELEELVEGENWGGLYDYRRKYLRRIPKDPFDRYDEGWG
ncbi:MAG: type II secretion system protein, partial [Desulfuromonadales bacterium]|nr:type II secretion system protein [Desulfuromonadales bacterium]NIR34146.1 type II secretion system protein [Desulfuromonadales bacterium]NIS40229.1 type II secretion system protein [Desulfuromonadales bacterium]